MSHGQRRAGTDALILREPRVRAATRTPTAVSRGTRRQIRCRRRKSARNSSVGRSEMLRLAANRLCDAGLVPLMLVHDGILFELDNEEQVAHAIEIMRGAGRDVCGGFEIDVDVDQKLIGGARYRDKRPVAESMWNTVMATLREIGALPKVG